jgi:hypothetical protein
MVGSSGGPLVNNKGKVVGMAIGYFEDLDLSKKSSYKRKFFQIEVPDSHKPHEDFLVSQFRNHNLGIKCSHELLKSLITEYPYPNETLSQDLINSLFTPMDQPCNVKRPLDGNESLDVALLEKLNKKTQRILAKSQENLKKFLEKRDPSVIRKEIKKEDEVPNKNASKRKKSHSKKELSTK